jgi:hypothetical protein
MKIPFLSVRSLAVAFTTLLGLGGSSAEPAKPPGNQMKRLHPDQIQSRETVIVDEWVTIGEIRTNSATFNPELSRQTVILDRDKRPFLFPPMAAWQRITNGMPVRTMIELLGEPPLKSENSPQDTLSRYIYGWIRYKDKASLIPLYFSVIASEGHVILRDDPFGGELSQTGLPLVPRLISPSDGQSLEQHPRSTDFRWGPVHGAYPMGYVLEIECLQNGQWKSKAYPAKSCFATVDVPEAQKGRWRVMATNELGSGAWSSYRTFEYTR